MARWRSETPKWAKRLRNTAATISAALPAAYASVSAMNIEIPSTYKYIIASLTFGSVLITAVAGTRETNNGKAKRYDEQN